jgi:hypothetical protein
VSDQLSLSIWLERGSRANRLKHFEKLLRLFPFSQREEQGQTTVSVQAVSVTEPPLLESPMNGPIEVNEALEALADYAGDDIAYGVEGWWDLWQYDSRQKQDDWKLAPARVSLACFGPDFDNGTERLLGEQEDLRIDFGVDSHYLPRLDLAGSGRMTESNLKSMLRLVHELDSQLPVAKRKLETESGENFADRLQEVMGGSRS